MIIVGIDPDKNGCIAVVDVLDRSIKRIDSVPVWTHPVTGKRWLDAPLAYLMLEHARNIGAEYVAVESAIVKPQFSAKGPALMGSVGEIHQTYGALRALSEVAFTRSRTIVAWPSAWKKEMGLDKDKDKSLALATELYPSHSALLSKKKNAGIAEAILLCEWAKNKCT